MLLSSLSTEKEPPVCIAWNLMKETPTIKEVKFGPCNVTICSAQISPSGVAVAVSKYA
jgi:hypothetical protein